jgi:DNA helicase-2/ATP-dependent DNA helicase PcrA
MNLLTSLNDAQREAVQQTQGPLLVLAGAGSGKTRVLTTRIAYLVREKGIPPYHILAITFTNKAAAEMKGRVEAMVPESIRELWVSTFHSACLRILRRQAKFLGYEGNFVIYDDADQQTVVKDCIKELNFDDKRFTPRSFASAISQAKSRLMDYVSFEEQAYDYFSKIVARVYELYQKRLKNNNALDFDDLLMLTVRLFQQNQAVLAYYQNKFRYILVDEYQDTNHAQYVLVNLLAGQHRNLCVVGDPDQSIYNFRGADIQNILSFEKDYPEARIIKLEQNYRSTGTILEAANNVIKNNPNRKDKQLWTAAGEGTPLVVHLANDEKMEAHYVAGRIELLHGIKGMGYSSFAVLYRTHAMSRTIEEILIRRSIPYTIIGGLKFYDRKEIKDLLAYLRLLDNPRDTVSLARIINVPKRGIGDASLQKILNYAAAAGVDLIMALSGAAEIPGLTGKAKKAAALLGGVLGGIAAEAGEMSVTEITGSILEKTGYWAELDAENTVESRTRQENLKEFLTVTGDFDSHAEEKTLTEFLSGIALVAVVDNLDEDAEKVVLMSLHSAKGLEFPVIFLIGMEEGVFPHSRSLDDSGEMEEERRIAYVGITRAEKMLYLTHSWQRTLYGATRLNPRSRFLEEIPEHLTSPNDLLDEEMQSRFKTTDEKPAPVFGRSKFSRAGGAQPAAGIVTLAAGDEVRHSKWGHGTVLEVRGRGENAEIKIDFPGFGPKTLLAKFAPLEKLN